MNKVLIILLISGLGMAASVSAEGVYKYVKDGKVVYSDQPPPNVKAEKIEAYGSKHPDSRPTRGQPEPKPEDDSRAAIRAHECDSARARLVQYQNAPTLIQSNLKGEKKELTASERIDVIVRTQSDVNELCGESPPQSATASESPDSGDPEASEAGNY